MWRGEGRINYEKKRLWKKLMLLCGKKASLVSWACLKVSSSVHEEEIFSKLKVRWYPMIPTQQRGWSTAFCWLTAACAQSVDVEMYLPIHLILYCLFNCCIVLLGNWAVLHLKISLKLIQFTKQFTWKIVLASKIYLDNVVLFCELFHKIIILTSSEVLKYNQVIA